MIPFAKPFFPPLATYQQLIADVYANGWLTNQGPLAEKLENDLRQLLGAPNLLLTANGTLALQFLVKAYGRGGEMITTPFSYVATTSAVAWEGCTPVFADIEFDTLNIDPASVEDCITPRTTAILATHVFGNPAGIEALQDIANRHGLALLYDAAHAFGATYRGKPLICYGDASICSLHATKLFHTVEGGLVYTRNPETLRQIDLMRNFGHDGPERFSGLGINGKLSEVHAAMGLANLPLLSQVMEERQLLSQNYDELLNGLPVRRQIMPPELTYNYAYYPVIFEDAETAQHTMQALAAQGIGTRRYFHPMLYQLPYVQSRQRLPVAEAVSGCVLCLPFFNGLTNQQQQEVVKALKKALRPQTQIAL